jgi:hypothetical protein
MDGFYYSIMKARFLIPGQPIKYNGRVMVFRRRLRNGHETTGRTVNLFQCDDYRGLDGPDDEGLCTLTDYQVAHGATPTTVRELQDIELLLISL